MSEPERGDEQRERLSKARTWWCCAAYRLLTGEQGEVIPDSAIDPVLASACGVSEGHMREVRNGHAHLAPEALSQLERSLGLRAEFCRVAVLGPSFEEGVGEYERLWVKSALPRYRISKIKYR